MPPSYSYSLALDNTAEIFFKTSVSVTILSNLYSNYTGKKIYLIRISTGIAFT